MFMVMKRNRIAKLRGVTNGKCQKLYLDDDYTSPTPDFYAVKNVCGMVASEDRDTAMVDLPNFFLQIETGEDDEPVIIKFTGAVALLLVEYNNR